MEAGATSYDIHPAALGVPRYAGSPFVTETTSGLVTTSVLLDDGRRAAVVDLPARPGRGRPRVYCPFCGAHGSYRTFADGETTPHFAHDGGAKCDPDALESIRHLRAKACLVEGLRVLRETSKPLLGQVTCRRCKNDFTATLLGASEWTSEAPEVRIASGHVVDVAAIGSHAVAFAIEVHATHPVDAAKDAAFSQGTLPCLEIDVRALIDDHGEIRWDGRNPLPAPRGKWHLELPPRPFLICGHCREAGPLAALRTPLQRLHEAAPLQAKALEDALASDLPAPRLQPTALDAVIAAVGTPEVFRASDAAEAQRLANRTFWPDPPSAFLGAIGAEPDSPWAGRPLEELWNEPYRALCDRAREVDVSERGPDALGDEVPGQAKRFGDEELAIAGQIATLSGTPRGNYFFTAHAVGALWEARKGGHTAMAEAALVSILVARGAVEAEVQRWLEKRTARGALLHRSKGKVALQSDALAEQRVATHPRVRWAHSTLPMAARPKSSSDAPLNAEQRKAIQAAGAHRFAVITGAAGTGKTYVVREMLKGMFAKWPQGRWVLTAPSHKALQRLRESVGNVGGELEFRTVQSLVRLPPYGRFAPTGVVVDEAGYVGVHAFASLLRVTERVRHLVLVGDHNQLPSIERGAALRDVLACSRIPAVQLVAPKRADDERGLHAAAEAILRGEVPSEAAGVKVRRERGDLTAAALDALSAFAVEHGVDSVQVIAGPNSVVDAVNKEVQKRFNRDGTPLPFAPHLRVGDRVMSKANDSALNLFNGEVAQIVAYAANTFQLRAGGETWSVPSAAAEHLTLGYAITIHKSQGSEWENIVVVAPSRRSPLSTRALLYTAATRARRNLVLIGRPGDLEAAAKNEAPRLTLLGAFLHDVR